MKSPKQYWESCFTGIDAATHDFSHSRPSTALIDVCQTYLKPGDRVLDLGCGGGRNAHYLAQRGYHVYGVDVAEGAVRVCQKRFARYNLSGEFNQGSFDNIPYEDGYFAAVFCIAALDHVSLRQAQSAMREMRRVLAPGGICLLTFDPEDTDDDMLDDAEVLADGTLRFIKGDQAGMLFRRYRDGEIRTLVGEDRLLSFQHSDDGARIVMCR